MNKRAYSHELRLIRKSYVTGFMIIAAAILVIGVCILVAYSELLAIGVIISLIGFFLVAIGLGVSVAKALQPSEVWIDGPNLCVRRGRSVRSYAVSDVRLQKVVDLRLYGGSVAIGLHLRVPHKDGRVPDYSTRSAIRRTTRVVQLSSLVYCGDADVTMLRMANVLTPLAA